MSSSTPSEPAGQPEFLTQGDAGPARRSRTKPVLLASVGVLAAGAVAVGAWGVAQLTGGGPGPAAVLPDTTLAYASVDLDPSASQKIEAIKTLRKFPVIAGELNLGTRDDLREWFVNRLKQDGDCDGLDYDGDIAPWIGDKAALAAVPNAEHTADVLFALQVSDESTAREGIARIFQKCSEDETHGVAFLDGYVLVAETEGIATAAAAGAKKASLADDPQFNSALARVGDLGVVTVYVAEEGPRALYDATVGSLMGLGSTCEATGGAAPDDLPELCDDLNSRDREDGAQGFAKALANFKGGAATVRFHDGGIELAVAGEGLSGADAEAQPTTIGDLPDTTIGALGISLPAGWVTRLETVLKEGRGAALYDATLAQAEASTGLNLPEDIETLLGTGIVLAVDGATDWDSLPSSQTPGDLKVGLRIDGDESEVRRIIETIVRAAGMPPGEIVKVRAAGGQVAVGFDDGYLDKLLAGGDLSSADTFRAAVPEADKASAALFVDFDAADGWLERLVAQMTDQDGAAVANARPFDALGASAWGEGDVTHLLLRFSTD